MKKIKLITICTILTLNCFSQNLSNIQISTEINVFDKENNIKESKLATYNFQNNQKMCKWELKIIRVKRTYKIVSFEATEIDTVKIEPQGFTIDTDNPIPSGEQDKVVLENLMRFIANPVNFKKTSEGVFKGAKIQGGSPNVETFFLDKFPCLNSDLFLSPIELNFNSEISSLIDSVKSEAYSGIFINKYLKNENGYKVEGRFIPIKSLKSKGESNFAETEWVIFNYNGFIESNLNKISKISLEVESKTKTTFKGMQIGNSDTEQYKLLVKNKF